MTNEDRLQSQCVRWFRLQYPNHVLFAIPNGGNRNAVTGAVLKKTGTLAGVADLFLMHAAYCNHGLFIEMKVGKNTLTQTQKDFADKAHAAGYGYMICRTLDDFIETVNEYLQ
jgi:hypothetical protein